MAVVSSRNLSFGGGLSIGNPVFTPAALFSAGEQGVWYDPSDFSTLYQDTSGSTPVTAVEQPVGMMLDKSQGLVLGSELFSDFGSIGTWTDNGDGTWSISSAAAQTDLRVDYTGTSGKWYTISYTITNQSGAITVYYLNSVPEYNITNGTKTGIRLSNAGYFIIRAAAGASATVSNITIRELPGNHAVAANNSTARPVLRSRYNQYLYSEELTNAYWSQTTAITVTDNVAVSPRGDTTASLLVPDGTLTQHFFRRAGVSNDGISFYAKAAGYTTLSVRGGGVSANNADFNLLTGVVSGVFSAGCSMVDVGNGWWRCFYPSTSDLRIYPNTAASYSGDGVSGIYLWGVQSTIAGGSSIINGEYQRIAAATDYDTDATKFLPYLYFDGVDDYLTSPNHPFTFTGEVSFFAGATHTATNTYSTLFSAGTTGNGTTNQRKTMAFQFSNATQIPFGDRPAFSTDCWAPSGVYATPDNIFAPGTYICTANISNWSTQHSGGTVMRVDGVPQTVTSYNAGNILGLNSGPINIGCYDQTALATGFFNGSIYSLIVRGKTTLPSEITATEAWVADKTGVTL